VVEGFRTSADITLGEEPMSQIATVRGPLDTAQLGQTLMHEHVFVLSPEIQQNFPADWDEEERVADAVTKLRALREVGVRTIVDLTVIGLGRFIPRIQRVNEQVDINIVVATGVYTYDELPFYFRNPVRRAPDGSDLMASYFIADITEGIAETGVRAGVLKCAIDAPGMTPGVERVLRAVCAAHRATGAPITVHTHPESRSGLAVARVVAEEEVDPRAVVLGHSGDTADADYLAELADAGFVLGMDRFGINFAISFEQRVGAVVEMCRRGYAASMVLSHDASCYIDWFDNAMIPTVLPSWHYRHIHDDVLPALRRAEVTEEQIATMLVDTPRRYFEGPP
jgi:phosphotriesterase-related protein